MKIYVASSWKNPYQQELVALLREQGYKVYDFKNPHPGNYGFQWEQIDPGWKKWGNWDYREALNHPFAAVGFANNYAAMQWSDVIVGITPFGLSTGMEMGWDAGNGKKTVLYLADRIKPELMVKMFDYIVLDNTELLVVLEKLEREKSHAGNETH